MPAPAEVVLPMVMHIGAPAVPVVKVGDTVGVGQKVADAGGFVSAPIHATVSGTVKKIDQVLTSVGSTVAAIVIESDGEMRPYEGICPPAIETAEDFAAAVREGGIVGLGGAGFPTAVKVALKDPSMLDVVLINGAECEPYITSDTRVMLEQTDRIAEGVALLRRYLGAKKFIIGIESNKPECIAKMKECFAGETDVSVATLPPIYPQGGEKVLIYQTTGRVVPEGKLPIDVGALVINCTTLAAIASYVATGMPLVEKVVTVAGSAVAEPKNVIVPIGTRISDVFDFCGGFRRDPKKVLYGGPMMGISVPSLSEPVLKNTNALLAFDEKDARVPEETPCIHCGACVTHCPMRLNPPAIAKAAALGDKEGLVRERVNLCIECGSCAYVCPARRKLVQRHKLAKASLRKN